jgi:hypothetical protein
LVLKLTFNDKNIRNLFLFEIFQEDYESIITDYKAAKKIITKAEALNSCLFKQVNDDIEKRIDNVKRVLYEKLTQFPCNPDDQKIIIDYIYSIETKSNFDVGWFCLENERTWIMQVIIDSRDMHIADEKVANVTKESQNQQQQQQQTQLNQPIQQSFEQENELRIKPHERNKFIEDLCEMFLDIFTDYWNLSKMYSQGLLLPNFEDSGSISNEKSKIKLHRSDEVQRFIEEILDTFCNIVRDAFIPDDKIQQLSVSVDDKSLLKWPKTDEKKATQILTHCLRVCRFDMQNENVVFFFLVNFPNIFIFQNVCLANTCSRSA